VGDGCGRGLGPLDGTHCRGPGGGGGELDGGGDGEAGDLLRQGVLLGGGPGVEVGFVVEDDGDHELAAGGDLLGRRGGAHRHRVGLGGGGGGEPENRCRGEDEGPQRGGEG